MSSTAATSRSATTIYRVDEDGDGVDSSIVEGLDMLTRYAPFDVLRTIEGEIESSDGIPLEEGLSTAGFLKAVVPNSFGEVPLPSAPEPTMHDEHFAGVVPGTAVTFQIQAQNDIIPATKVPQVFRARIEISAGRCADLDARDVLIMVPPLSLAPPE